MLGPFIGQNIHFAISLAAALACFAAAWLYFDSYHLAKHAKELWKSFGFICLCAAFLLFATLSETTLATTGFSRTAGSISAALRLLGYLAIMIGSLIDPLQKVPRITNTPPPQTKTFAGFVLPTLAISYLLPLGAFGNAILMFRRSFKGLEKHLRPLIVVFSLLTLFETASLARLFRTTENVASYSLIKSFGVVWALEHALLAAAAIVLGIWLWQYLVTRLESQLTLMFTAATLIIFLLTTTTFTFSLLRSVQSETLDNLKTNSKVVNYALSAKESELKTAAETLAGSGELITAIVNRDRARITSLVQPVLAKRAASSLVITTAKGEVLVRAENSQLWGDSLSEDPFVKQALLGETRTGIATKSDIAAPQVLIQAVGPVSNAGQVIGTVTVANIIDNGFLDGLKRTTGLESAVYASNIRSATTLVAADGKSRLVGINETDKTVRQVVLADGKTYAGNLKVLGVPYLAVYAPLTGADGKVAGMLFAGRPQAALLDSAARSIEVTLVSAAALLSSSVFVWYFAAKYIKKQLR